MSRKTGRTIVIWLSMLVAIIGFGYFGYLRYQGEARPLWDKVAMAYGGVFVIFLFFDEVGRQAARHRRESDARKQRPRPRPSNAAGQRVALAQTRITAGQLRLERVKSDRADLFLSMVDDAVTEVAALEDRLPERDESGHVTGGDVRLWLEDSRFYPFYIMYHDQCIGCCVLHPVHPSHEIQLFYIQPPMRRRGAGSTALDKLSEFASLVGSPDELVCEVSRNNMRAQRFFEVNGFRVIPREDTTLGTVEMTKRVRTSDADRDEPTSR